MGKKTRLGIAALAVLLVAAAPGFAQVIKDETVNTARTGEITAVDMKARTVSLKEADGTASVISVDDKTTIMSSDKMIKLDGLHVGEWVAVDADTKDGKNVATYIEVVDDPEAQ